MPHAPGSRNRRPRNGLTLVDTSVWIDHLRRGDEQLVALLHDGLVLTHPMVIGELCCGQLRDRSRVLAWLDDLPGATIASDNEVRTLIERHDLPGRGIGYVDAHLLAATRLTGSARLWTRDRRLRSVAQALGVLST